MRTCVLCITTLITTLFAFDPSPLDALLSGYKRTTTTFLMCPLEEDLIKYIKAKPTHYFVLWNPHYKPLDHKLPPNLTILSGNCTHEKLKHLTECEHFDHALITQHHIKPSYCYVEILLKLSNCTLSTLPDSHDVQRMVKRTNDIKCISINHQMYYKFTQTKLFLLRTTWLQEPSNDNCCRVILANNDHKLLKKMYGEHHTQSKWIPGINLITFKMLEGSYPTLDNLNTQLKQLYNIEHNDWMPNNMVVRGTFLKLIDFIDPHGNETRSVKSPTLLSLIQKLILSTDPNDVVYYQDQILEYNTNAIHPDT